MSSMQTSAEEIQHLRRSLRELVALSTLPAVWTGHEPRMIGVGLAEVLQSLLRLELVYICIRLAPEVEAVEVVRADQELDQAYRLREVRRALAPWLSSAGAAPPSSIPNPLGTGVIQVAAVPLGYSGEYGVVVTGARQTDFPTELDRLLLSVGANQAATALRGAGLVAALRDADRLKDDLLAREQTARAHAEAAQKQVTTVLERVADAFIALDREWRLTYLNRATEHMLRRLQQTPQALIGANLWEEFPELIGSRFEQEWRRAVVEQVTVEFEAFYPPLNAWLAVHAYPSTDGLSVYFQDITQRRQTEAALEQSRRRLQALFDHALDGMLLSDDQGRYLDVNPAFCALIGYSREELLQRAIWDLTWQPDLAHGQQLWRDFLATGTQSGEFTLRRKDGAVVEIEYRAVANIVPGVHLSVLQDVTERKRAEARQRLLAEASAVLSASLDYETTLTNIAQLTVPSLADWCVIDIREEDGAIRRLAAAHADPAKAELLRHMQERYPLDPHQPHAILDVLRTGRAKLYTDVSEAQVSAAARDAEQTYIFRRLGLESVMIVPLIAGGRPFGAISLVSADPRRRYIPADVAFAEDLAGRCALAVENARLYREAQEATHAKEESLALLDTLLTSAPVGLGFLDRALRYVRINPALAAINGMPPEAHLGRLTHEVNPRLMSALDPLRRRAIETGKPVVNAEVSGETRAAPGELQHWLVSYYPVRTPAGEFLGLGIVVVEITARKRAEEQLQASLREKEVLLREIHHRVKNNLQVISSLLSLQAASSQDRATLALIQDSQHRIQSMALIHESLYQSRDLGHINFAHYLRTLADDLWRAYRVDDTRIRMHLDAEEVYLDIDKATPCGLLLNELVANCLKHAFPREHGGDVHIRLRTAPERRVTLVVRDTGSGFPEAIDFRHTDTLGLQLVTTLTEQLQGTITLERDGGTTFTITFPV